jgi:hypothetical protein
MRGQRVTPFFCLARAAWIPYALTWDPETGAMRGAKDPHGFDSYREVVEASAETQFGRPIYFAQQPTRVQHTPLSHRRPLGQVAPRVLP